MASTPEEKWANREKARVAVEEDGWSIRRAADHFEVARSSLQRHIVQRPTAPVKHGKEMLLTDAQEIGLVETILWRSKRGMRMEVDELRYLARQVATQSGMQLGSTSPTRRWVDGFLIRHKAKVSKRRSQILSTRRFQESSEEGMRSFYANLEEAIGSLDASRVWNCDESGFCPQGRSGGRVLCGKGMNANVLRSSDKENVSLMACVAADGSSMPMMFIFPGKTRQIEWMDGTDDDAVCAVTESSYINGNLFLHWLKFYDRQLTKRGVQRPVLLVLDGHYSHINLSVLEFAVKNKIDLFVLPSQTSHFTQPLDNAVFRSLKAGFERQLREFPLVNRGERPKRQHIAHLITEAWALSVKRSTVVASFERTGIFPPDLTVILAKCIGDKAPVQDLPHVSRLLAMDKDPLVPLFMTRLMRSQLTDAGYNPETLNVVFMASQMSSSQSPPQNEKRACRTFVNGGGVLITRPEMIQLAQDAFEAKAAAEQAKQEKKSKREQDQHERKRKRELLAAEALKRKHVRDFERTVKQVLKKQQQADRKKAREQKIQRRPSPKPSGRQTSTLEPIERQIDFGDASITNDPSVIEIGPNEVVI